MTTILKGNIVSAPACGRLDVTEHGYLIAENGVITGVYPVLPEQYAGASVEDYGDCLIVQSFADLHLHAPQYPMLGMGMDLPLLDWLNAYAFPTEARFAEPDYARTVYRQLAGELASHGTTRPQRRTRRVGGDHGGIHARNAAVAGCLSGFPAHQADSDPPVHPLLHE